MGLNTTVQFRTDSAIKEAAFSVFKEMGINPSTAMQLFLQQVQRTRTLPFIVTANHASEAESKEDGYDDWLRARLERTINMLDSGEMKTHSLEEVQTYLQVERAKRREQRALSTNTAKN